MAPLISFYNPGDGCHHQEKSTRDQSEVLSPWGDGNPAEAGVSLNAPDKSDPNLYFNKIVGGRGAEIPRPEILEMI